MAVQQVLDRSLMGCAANLALNGYKISNPTVLARSSMRNWSNFYEAAADASLCGSSDPEKMHELMATTWKRPSKTSAKSKTMRE